ncbi:GerAB/ArcD/ProY family transporter [Mesobacillus foraminis]|uniref:GerAB/ArcD/ProY family transporter n=1 Tax=Mesobacillus foraminis TaxID=279826 RepID=UPI001BEAD0FF|nr:GerAB/ArcD/ProY family transporter [Mesobacillus foraminis]MBT2759192.1 GerAB/ArcD/ProY family transporter [Mesobacillus foraminis]
MEKAKISAYQLFVLMLLFELGSAILVPLAIDAKQDAWLAILFGWAGGIVVFWMQYRLFHSYPDLVPTEYMQKILGKFLGRILGFMYILFFVYLSSRDLRDFGEMLLTFAYIETPLFIVNGLFVLVIIYALRKGIEVLARTGEIFFIMMYILAFMGFVLIIFSGLIDINNLKPVLEAGILPVLKVGFTETIFFPFGEAIVFSMLLPYLANPRKAKLTSFFALTLSGINIAIVMIMNISVLGVDLTSRSQFPLLSTVQTIQVAEFLERLDVFFMLAMVIGIFFKASIYLYGAIAGAAVLFKVKKPSNLVYPLGLIALFMSVTIASSYSEHLYEGRYAGLFFIFPAFMIIIPFLLLVISQIKNRKRRSSTEEPK